jgi:hypothetical protein
MEHFTFSAACRRFHGFGRRRRILSGTPPTK